MPASLKLNGASISLDRRSPVSTRDDYRQNAWECLRWARTAVDPRDKAIFVRMAQTWTKLADQVATLQTPARYFR